MGSIPASPYARNVPLLLCQELFNEASLPAWILGISPRLSRLLKELSKIDPKIKIEMPMLCMTSLSRLGDACIERELEVAATNAEKNSNIQVNKPQMRTPRIQRAVPAPPSPPTLPFEKVVRDKLIKTGEDHTKLLC